jgi:hypothetical protein
MNYSNSPLMFWGSLFLYAAIMAVFIVKGWQKR